MAHVTPSRPAPFGAVTAYRVTNLVHKAYATVVAWNDTRRTINELSALSDAQLSDIGLDRGSLDTVSHSLTRR